MVYDPGPLRQEKFTTRERVETLNIQTGDINVGRCERTDDEES